MTTTTTMVQSTSAHLPPVSEGLELANRSGKGDQRKASSRERTSQVLPDGSHDSSGGGKTARHVGEDGSSSFSFHYSPPFWM